MIPKEIYINEYIEDGATVLGSIWRDNRDHVFRDRDQNYLRTIKFVRADLEDDLLKASQMLQTISCSGYCEAYELGWNEAVKHNRLVLKCAAGDTKACAQIGQTKIPAHVSTDRDLPGA